MGIAIIRGLHLIRNIKGRLELKELHSTNWISIGDFQLMFYDESVRDYKLFLWEYDHIDDNTEVFVNKIDTVLKLIYVSGCVVRCGIASHIMDRLPDRWYVTAPTEGNYWAKIAEGNIRFYTEKYKGFCIKITNKVLVSGKRDKEYHVFNQVLDGWYNWGKVHVDVVDANNIMFSILDESVDNEVEKSVVERFHLCSTLFEEVSPTTLGVCGVVLDGLNCIRTRTAEYKNIIDKVESILNDACLIMSSGNELSDTFIYNVNNVFRCVCGEPTARFIINWYKHKLCEKYIFHCVKYDKGCKRFLCYFCRLTDNSVYSVREILCRTGSELLFEEDFYTIKE